MALIEAYLDRLAGRITAVTFLEDDDTAVVPAKPDMLVPMYDRTAQAGNWAVCWLTGDGVIFSERCKNYGAALMLSRQRKRVPMWVLHVTDQELSAAKLCLQYRATDWLTAALLDRELRSMLSVAVSANIPCCSTHQQPRRTRDTRVPAGADRDLAVRVVVNPGRESR